MRSNAISSASSRERGAVSFDPAKTGGTVDGLFAVEEDTGQAGAGAAERLAAVLEPNLGRLRQSGHNVIFASLAMRARVGQPDLATVSRVDGAVKLLSAFDTQGPGRGYLGKDRGWESPRKTAEEDGLELPAYHELEAMAVATFDLVIETAGEHRRRFGDHFHLIDHAAALIDLADCGFPDLARKGIAAHREHFARLRALPVLDGELGKLVKPEIDPFSPDYWTRRKSFQWEA